MDEIGTAFFREHSPCGVQSLFVFPLLNPLVDALFKASLVAGILPVFQFICQVHVSLPERLRFPEAPHNHVCVVRERRAGASCLSIFQQTLYFNSFKKALYKASAIILRIKLYFSLSLSQDS